MAGLKALKSLMHSHRPAKWVLSRVPLGKRLRLKEDVYKQIKEREWILNKIDGEGVHLIHESGAYGLIVSIEDIDWNQLDIELSKEPSRSFFVVKDGKRSGQGRDRPDLHSLP